MSTKRHDLIDFMAQIEQMMAQEYERIRKHSAAHPETAGDQGEENWAGLFREWLPPTYQIRTRGRLIDQQGSTTPQVDVLVLKPAYPRALLDKKYYLAAGVAAAFECKLTLTAADIREAVKTAVDVKSLFPARIGTPYRELHSPIIFGLLAHSHNWKGSRSTPLGNIDEALRASDRDTVAHPRLGLDLLCVADLATWNLSLTTFQGPAQFHEKWPRIADAMVANGFPEDLAEGYASTCYLQHDKKTNAASLSTPVGLLLSSLFRRLAWENPEARDLASYFGRTIIASGGGIGRQWPPTIYSDQVRHKLAYRELSSLVPWDEWRSSFW